MLAYANPFMATEAARAARREAGRDHAGRHRRLLLHQRRRRGERERDQAGADGDRSSQDSCALPLVSRRNRGQHHADRRSAPLGRRAWHPRRRPRAGSVSRHRARVGHRRAVARDARGSDSARRTADDCRIHPRDGDRHQRRPRAARRLHAGRARAVHEARHPDDLRRGDGRLRPHRRVVRDRSLESRAGHHHDGEGADRAPTCSWAPSACAASSRTSSTTRCSTAG